MKKLPAVWMPSLAILAIASNAWAAEAPEIPADFAPWLLAGTAGLIVMLKTLRRK